MKKIIYIAEVSDDNSSTYTATFDRAAARKAAVQYKGHLTARELETHTVSVSAYEIEVADGDTRSADQLFKDWANAEPWLPDSVEYEEV